MEIWEVIGVDTQASEKDRRTGELIAGVKYHLAGDNFDGPADRYLGRCVSVLFISNEDRQRFKYDADIGDLVLVGYNRWGRVSAFSPAP